DRGLPESAVPVRNLSSDPGRTVSAQVSVDFLQLVRFGLRRADDPLILASVKVADALLKLDTPAGPCWHRYNEDGYGEHDDGSAYDGSGRGRAWPLLTGERGHYELCCGRDVLPYLLAMTRMTSPGGMLPEQVWDAAPIPARGLLPGRPTGSAMPLTLAHPAAILPLRGLKYLRTAPLVIGAMIPDLPYYMPGRLNILRPETHSLTGSLTTCLALGYAALDAVYLLRRPLTALLS